MLFTKEIFFFPLVNSQQNVKVRGQGDWTESTRTGNRGSQGLGGKWGEQEGGGLAEGKPGRLSTDKRELEMNQEEMPVHPLDPRFICDWL